LGWDLAGLGAAADAAGGARPPPPPPPVLAAGGTMGCPPLSKNISVAACGCARDGEMMVRDLGYSCPGAGLGGGAQRGKVVQEEVRSDPKRSIRGRTCRCRHQRP
jgi:hypothetical protein